MTTELQRPPAQPSRFKPWMRWTTCVVVVFGGIVFTWRHVDAKARRELEAAKAAFAAHGFPTQIEEVMPPPVAEADNADGLLRDAWAIVSGSPDWNASARVTVFEELELVNYRTVATATEPSHLLPEGLAELRRLARDPAVARAAEVLRDAVRKPAWRPVIDLEAGMQMLLPSAGPIRTFVRILCWRSLALAQDPATVTEAWEYLQTAQILAEWVDETPFLILHLTSNACHGLIRAAALDVMEITHDAPGSNALLQSELRSLAADRKSLESAIHAERIVGLAWFETHVARKEDWLGMIAANGNGPAWLRWAHPWLTPILSPLARPRLYMELRKCHELHLKAALALRSDGPSAMAQLHAVRREAETSTILASVLILTSLESLARIDCMQRTERRAFVAALTAWNHRRQFGTWPETLAELALPDNVTVDACSHQPLVLRADAAGITVYGRGFDGDDDGGREIDRRSGSDDGDVVVQLHLPRSGMVADPNPHAD